MLSKNLKSRFYGLILGNMPTIMYPSFQICGGLLNLENRILP